MVRKDDKTKTDSMVAKESVQLMKNMIADTMPEERVDVELKDEALHMGVHVIWLDIGKSVVFNDGKANVSVSTQATLREMGVIE